MNKQYLLITICIATNASYAMEWALPKKNETYEEMQHRYIKSYEVLDDVWTKGKKSPHYTCARQQTYSKVPFFTLHQAIKSKNLEQCVLHLAQPRTVQLLTRTKKSSLLHAAARSGFYPFSVFLLELERDPKVDFTLPDKKGKTPLDYAIDAGNNHVCALLLSYKAGKHKVRGIPNISKALEFSFASGISSKDLIRLYHLFNNGKRAFKLVSPEELLISCAHNLTPDKMYSRFPTFVELGVQWMAPNKDGFTLLHKIVADHSQASDKKVAACLQVLPGMQQTLEQSAMHTLLMIQSFRKHVSPIFSRIPKDVLRYVLAPFICPLLKTKGLSNHKDLSNAVDAQLHLLKKLLSLKDASGNRPHRQLHADGNFVYYSELDPDNVESLRNKVTQITCLIRGIPYHQEIKSKL